MSCAYCTSADALDIDRFLIDHSKGKLNTYVCISSGSRLYTSTHYGNEEIISKYVKIKYCPMCGRKI